MDERNPKPEENSPTAPEPARSTLLPTNELGDAHEVLAAVSPAPFAVWSTTLWSVVLAVGAAFVLFAITNTDREQSIEHPEAYLERVVGRDLDAAEYGARMPAWEKRLNLGQVASPPEALTEAIKVYQKFKAEGVFDDTARIQKTLAILLAEAGQLEQAWQELDQPAEEEPVSGFRVLFEAAYAPKAGTTIPAKGAVQGITPEWAQDRFTGRLAERRGDQTAVRRAEERSQARGARYQRRATWISVSSLLLVASGLAVIVSWLWRRWPLEVARGNPVGRWTLANGYAVLVRGATGGVILAGSVAYLSTYVSAVAGFATLVSAAPLLLLTWKYLTRPEHQTFPGTFGLVLEEGKGRRLFLITLAAAAVMIVGETVLAEISSHWQDSSLAETIPEEFLFGSWAEVLFSAMDAIIWAPLVEEIAFRGLLYASLRRRLGVFTAAAVSSIIFGLVHGYSLQGLLIICWSGFVWALVYEKSRSLWPGILCHAISNTLAMAAPIVLYRL